MGGSGAPLAVIEGASLALNRHPDIFYLIYGTNAAYQLIANYPNLQGKFEFIEVSSVISDHEQPIKALKLGVESSMRKAVDAVKEKRANACVSSGNTGALMVIAKMVLRELNDIKRPAIVGVMPSIHGGSVMLDLGANTECDEHNLFQFAVMGVCFAQAVLSKANPRVALLNIGIEQIKGRELEKKTYALLENSGLNFIGYIEGHDLTKGMADVIVTDGFTGNMALKAAEGAVRYTMALMKEGFKANLPSQIGGMLAKKSLRRSFEPIDPNEKNGAMFIGINGIVVKSHGSALPIGFANAICVAYDLAAREINHAIANGLKTFHETKEATSLVDKIKETSAKILGLR